MRRATCSFVNVVKGGNVPKEFIPAVEKGFKDCLGNGVLGGFPIDLVLRLL